MAALAAGHRSLREAPPCQIILAIDESHKELDQNFPGISYLLRGRQYQIFVNLTEPALLDERLGTID
jgi:hypothetical protein